METKAVRGEVVVNPHLPRFLAWMVCRLSAFSRCLFVKLALRIENRDL